MLDLPDITCYGLNVCVSSPPNSYVEALTSDVMVFRDEGLKEEFRVR